MKMSLFKKKKTKTITSIKPIKKVPYNKETDKIIADIFEGKYFLLATLDVLEFKNGIDWTYEHPESTKTYQLYLHSLEPIHYLCAYYEEKQDKKSLQKAYDILLDWIRHDTKAGEEGASYRWT